jgi:hypothetical protein
MRGGRCHEGVAISRFPGADFEAHVRRRRRRLRAAGIGVAALVVAAVATGTIAASRAPGAAPPAAPASSEEVLDGFRITWLPGETVRAGADSTYRATVDEQGLVDGSPVTGEPWASVAMRRFDRGVGVGLFVTVLRPEPAGAAPVADRLERWVTRGATPVRAFDTPAGRARLVAHVGSEVTTHEAVIVTPGHVVLTVGGNGAFTAAEIEAVARGIGSS